MNALTNLRTAILAVLVVVGLPGLAAAFDKTVPAKGLTDVAVHTLSGQVDLIGWDKAEVKVEWTEDDANRQPHVSADNGRLRIGGDPKQDRGLTADLKVRLPRGLRVEVKTISGDLKVIGLTGGARLKSISGEVDAVDCRGGLTIKTVSGDVDLQKVSGDVEVKSVSGEVDLVEVDAPLLEVKTVSGDIDHRGPLFKVRVTSHSGEVRLQGALKPGADLRAKSFSGDLSLLLPADSAFDLNAGTRSGGVQCDFELSGGERKSNDVSGRVGPGGAELDLSSFSGEIRIRKSK